MRRRESGVCHCGANMNDHTGWDNHSPVDMGYPPLNVRVHGWVHRRREEAEFLWDIIRTVAYAIRKRMW